MSITYRTTRLCWLRCASVLALSLPAPAFAEDTVEATQDQPEEDYPIAAAPTADEEETTQTVAENAIAQSNDAFGRQVGSERTGLYSSREVRGFNPVDAGNVRLEALYYDQVNGLSPRINSSSTIRVGIATLGYAFPAPTGLVDYGLRKAAFDRSLTVDVSRRERGHEGFGYDLRLGGIAPGVGLFSGGYYRASQSDDSSRAHRANAGFVLSYDPKAETEVLTFASVGGVRDDEARSMIFMAGDALPPEIERFRFLGQGWADNESNTLDGGLIVRAPLSPDLRLESGAFFSGKRDLSRFSDLMTGVTADGAIAERAIIASPSSFDRSLSGELRLVQKFALLGHAQQLSASLRGRDRLRTFGGSQRISLGAGSLFVHDQRPEPQFAFGDTNRDKVRQFFTGIAWSGALTRFLRFDLGASAIDYTKTVDYAAADTPDVATGAKPIAWNGSLALALTKRLTLFGALARGMEEADVAPDLAVNRAEAPAAINTRQEELVVRYDPDDAVTLLLGAFRISKPYYNLDTALRYRLLGTVVNEGLEFSAIARPVSGMTLLGGAVLSEPALSGEAVDEGLIGTRPVGQPKVRMTGNFDWRLDQGTSPFSFDFTLDHKGSRPVNALGTLMVGAETTLDLGMRYRFNLGDADMVLRVRGENVLNAYGWNVSSSGALTYISARTVQFQLYAEF
ncbi:TonB-dependent receptor domain-containing protein [Aurantiacibacter flavus]|uniref:TonB-dependent receptor n=1 Tax=Aurantiacibacter flavus TaxID=3145232 RepID=A0ABV0D0J4_9SPHN